jgi:hypothetical protein
LEETIVLEKGGGGSEMSEDKGKATKVVSLYELREALKNLAFQQYKDMLAFIDAAFHDYEEYNKISEEMAKIKQQPVKTEPEKIPLVTEAQKRYITFLCGKYNEPLPNFERLTKEDASKLIDKLLEKGKKK